LPELNLEGVTGFLGDVGDVDTMASKAIYILEDNERLKQFKEAALKRATDFEISTIVPSYEQYYEEVIANVRKQHGS
jgi:glycosyltransferase involved in cell wall biosynthesis